MQVVSHENPDLICLQEVNRHVARSRHDDQPHRLARRWKRHPIFISSTCASRPAVTAISSCRAGPFASAIRSLFASNGENRAAPRSWSSRHHRDSFTSFTGTWVWRAPTALASPPLARPRPVPRVGAPADLDRRRLQRLAQYPGQRPDGKSRLRPGDRARSRFRSFPAYWPVVSLDKAFVRGPLVVRHARIVHSRLTRDASDHLPLLIEFHIPKPAQEAIVHARH